MLRLSKKLMFAIEAVLEIAWNSGTKPMLSRDINRRQGIPRRYLDSVLQELARADILRGIRGPYGGYCLARSPHEISLAQISEAVKATEAAWSPVDASLGTTLGEAIVRPLCLDLVAQWELELEKITIGDLCARAHAAGFSLTSKLR